MPNKPGPQKPKTAPGGQRPGKLKVMTTEERAWVVEMLCRELPVKEVYERFKREFKGGEAATYSLSAFSVYAKSDQFLREKDSFLSSCRKRAETEGFSHTGSRLMALGDIARQLKAKILDAWEVSKKDFNAREFAILCAEFRQYMGEIRAEAAPLGIQGAEVLSHFEAFSSWLNKRSGEPEQSVQASPLVATNRKSQELA